MNALKQSNLEEQADKLAKLTFLLARSCEEKEQYFTEHFGLTNGEFRCMRFLNDNTYLSVKELAAEMGLTPGRITHIVTALEEKGFVSREIDKNDRRNIRVCLTENALPFMEEVNRKMTLLHERVLEQMPVESREVVLSAMQELYESLSAWSKNKSIE